MPIERYQSELFVDENGYETVARGNPMFPCGAYWWDLADPKRDEVPWHWHEEVEVLIVKSGSLQLRINDKHHILHEGEGAYINSNIIHSIRAEGESISTLNSLVFSADILCGSAESVFNQRYVRPLLDCKALPFLPLRQDFEWEKNAAQNIMDAYNAYNDEKYGYELVVREKLTSMLHLIVTNNRHIIKEQYTSEDAEIVRLKTMIRHIQQNFTEKVKLQEIAAAANISERECLRCFKRTIGVSPIQYLLKYRVSIASQLLAESDFTVTEISDKTGFDNPSHFARTFKSLMARSPSEYRKEQQSRTV